MKDFAAGGHETRPYDGRRRDNLGRFLPRATVGVALVATRQAMPPPATIIDLAAGGHETRPYGAGHRVLPRVLQCQ